jgi:hypothetical protein
MLTNLLRFSILGVAVSTALYAVPANAQATRTWVSGVGDDANPCSRTAPCKTFAGAISKTAASGEINCIDPGGFGAVTITKSIAIDCANTEAGVLATIGGSGIIVNALASDVITLRGLDIDGAGTGANGIRVLSAASVTVDRVVVRGFRAAGGNGITFAPTAASKLFVADSLITNNGNGGTSGGILVRPTGTASANVILDNVRVEANNFGILFDGAGGTGGIRATVRGGMSSGNTLNGIGISSAGTSTLVMIDNVAVTSNLSGIVSAGAGSTGFVSNSTISGSSAPGVSFTAPATLISLKTNNLAGNPGGDGAFSSTILQQ